MIVFVESVLEFGVTGLAFLGQRFHARLLRAARSRKPSTVALVSMSVSLDGLLGSLRQLDGQLGKILARRDRPAGP